MFVDTMWHWYNIYCFFFEPRDSILEHTYASKDVVEITISEELKEKGADTLSGTTL